MRSPGLKRRSMGGFTLVEALLALVLAAVGTGIISDTLTGILRRSYITIAVTRISDQSERFAAAFTQQGKTAVGWALYADRAAYLADPVANVAAAGNVLVFQDQLSDGTLINELFEYDPAAQTLGPLRGRFYPTTHTFKQGCVLRRISNNLCPEFRLGASALVCAESLRTIRLRILW